MIKLGQEVRDKVTGFTGIAIAEIEYLFGCNQFGVSPKMNENGEIKDAEFFDVGRLELVSDGVSAEAGIPQWTDTVKLGNEARDRITGFTGIVIGRIRNFYGGIRYGMSPKVTKDGELKIAEFFDIGRVEVVGRGIAPEEVQAEKKGGVSKDIPRGIR